MSDSMTVGMSKLGQHPEIFERLAQDASEVIMWARGCRLKKDATNLQVARAMFKLLEDEGLEIVSKR